MPLFLLAESAIPLHLRRTSCLYFFIATSASTIFLAHNLFHELLLHGELINLADSAVDYRFEVSQPMSARSPYYIFCRDRPAADDIAKATLTTLKLSFSSALLPTTSRFDEDNHILWSSIGANRSIGCFCGRSTAKSPSPFVTTEHRLIRESMMLPS